MLKQKLKDLFPMVVDRLPDGLALRLIYFRKLKRVLHLNHPKSFTEKMQWLKLNYRLPIMPVLADKFAVREFVEGKIGAGALNKLHGVWDRPEDIAFDELPEKFVLKLTTGSHANLFCRDKAKFDRQDAVKKLRKWMATDFYIGLREWVYRDIKPRIISEEMLDDGTGLSPADYKFYCFDGVPEFVEVAMGRGEKLTITLLGMDWQPLPCTYYGYPPRSEPIAMPENFAEMAEFAKILSQGFPFSRIDFYSVKGKTIFGEITFYPGAGLAPFQPLEWDLKMGEKIRLPAKVR